jgi:hypothetical protein
VASTFLSRPSGKSSQRGAGLAAFGKHPGWDDHIQDQGLENDKLVEIRRLLYTEGVGPNIDSGAWDRLDDAQRLPGFAHVFAWFTGDGLFIGRLWSSVDGKGRSKYPMIVVAQVSGVSAAWALREILPRLEQLEGKCKAATTATDVKNVLDLEREKLRALVADAPQAGNEYEETAETLRALAGRKEWGDDSVGLRRVLYAIDREMAMFRATESRGRSRVLDDQPQHFRAPACAEGHANSILAWRGVGVRELAPGTPTLIFRSIERGIVDFIVGEPTASQLFALRANERGLPFASDVPYSIDETFRTAADAKIVLWKSGDTASPALGVPPASTKSTTRMPLPPPADAASTPAQTAASAAEPQPRKKFNWKLFGGGGAAVLLIVVGILAMSMDGGDGKKKLADAGATKPTDTGATKTPNDDKPKPPDPGANKATPPNPPVVTPVTPPAEGPFADADPRASWDGPTRLDAISASLGTLAKEPLAKGVTEAIEQLDRARAAVAKVRDQAWTKESAASVRADLKAAQTLVAGAESRAAEISLALQTAKAEASRKEDAIKKEEQRLASEKASEKAKMEEADRAAKAKEEEQRLAAEKAKKDQDAEAMAMAEAARKEEAKNAEAAKSALEQRGSKIRTLLDRAIAMLAMGYGPNEADPDGRTLSATMGDITKLDAVPALENDVAAVRTRLDTLLAISLTEDARKLSAQAEDAASKKLVSEALTAWKRSSSRGAPGSAAAFAEWSDFTSRTARAVASQIQNQARRTQVEVEIGAAVSQAFTRLANSMGPGSDAELEKLLASARAAGVPKDAVEGLQDHARFNAALVDFRKQASVLAAADAGQLRNATEAFMAQAAELKASRNASATALLAELKAAIEAPTDAPPPAAPAGPDPSNSGPATKGWTYQAGEAGVAKYTRADIPGVALEFARVEVPAGGGTKSLYLGTTEMSVAQFSAVFAGAGRGGDVPKILWGAGGDDVLLMPRVWIWGRGGQIVSAETKGGWVSATRLKLTSNAPAGVTETPTLDHPMQNVSFRAAAMCAGLAGCRLPTSGEWKAAAAGQDPKEGANLRDATWKKVHDHLVSQVPEADLSKWVKPFVPPGQAAGADDAVWPTDDGHPWFVPVSTGSQTFKNLIGNVWEYTFEAPDRFAATLEGDAVKAEYAQVRTIGASAVSSPDLVPDREQQVAANDASRRGFPDVGFRMAFEAGVGRPAAPPTFAQRVTRAAGACELVGP